MNHNDFLFSQLFMNHLENNDTKYKQLEYDLIFSEMLRHKDLFLKSNLNTDIKSEYDCITDYLTQDIKPI
jgi:hypothetical protein